jgi:hypothetical protein
MAETPMSGVTGGRRRRTTARNEAPTHSRKRSATATPRTYGTAPALDPRARTRRHRHLSPYFLNAFAQLGSKALARDHRPHRHLIEESQECPGCAETQSDPAGLATAPVHDQLDAALGYMLSEGPGGPSHDVLVGATWHRMGIGIVNPDGKMYVTVDVAP